MTDKKERILSTALQLFAKDGFVSTPTSKIAKLADVSEGLIFRHFKNKKGLLDAIVHEAELRLGRLWHEIMEEEDPKEILRKTIALSFQTDMDQEELDFWKLQFKLKWEQGYNSPDKMKPLLDKLEFAFRDLGYANPKGEAILLSQIIDAIAVEFLRDNISRSEAYKSFLLDKYKL